MDNKLTPKRSTVGLLRHSLYVGLQTRVAQSLGLSRSFVCRVMQGTKTSAKVSKALEREIARIEREIAKKQRRAK